MKTEGKVILNEIELEMVNGGSEAYLIGPGLQSGQIFLILPKNH